MKISINSPSYKRPGNIDILNYISFAQIWVCESEFNQYKKHHRGAKIISCKKGIQGNLARIRNHILDIEFGKGFDVVCLIDDDVKSIGFWERQKYHKLESADFKKWLLKYSIVCSEIGAKLWGVNLNPDKQYYLEYAPFTLTNYIGGPFSVHLRNSIRYDERFSLKQDYDLAIQHLNKHRKILRLQKFSYVAKQAGSGSGQVGGCSVYRNVKKDFEKLKLLQAKWGPRIVKQDFNLHRSHTSKRKRSFDINPIVRVPIRGI